MDWLDRINSAMEYIETNLADNISYDKIAQLVRRRRLTLAAFELQTMDAKVIDVAMKYSYD